MSDRHLLEDEPHPLLEPASPSYSSVTVRRAFIVWLCCGQRNSFRDVCNYFHHLEAMEEKLPADKRAISRHYEFDLFSNRPPTSDFLNETFPQLYSQNLSQAQIIKHLETHNKPVKPQPIEPKPNGTSTEDILATSQMIRNHCQTNMITLRHFMDEFKSYAEKCELENTVNNVAFYIQRKKVLDELKLVASGSEKFYLRNNKNNEIPGIGKVLKNEHKNGNIKEMDKENIGGQKINKKRAISKSYDTLSLENNSKPFGIKHVNGAKSFKVLKSDGSLSKSISVADIKDDLKNLHLGYNYQTLGAKVDKNHSIC